LGDRNNYDSSLQGLQNPKMEHLAAPENENNEPLEDLIREALNYDSTCYREALGIDMNSKEPNGVIKS